MAIHTLRTGDLAYYDSFTGLIPCKVRSIKGIGGICSTAQTVTLIVTAERKGYLKGDTIETTGLHAVPRGSVRRSKYTTGIRSYFVEPAAPAAAEPADVATVLALLLQHGNRPGKLIAVREEPITANEE